MKKNQTITLIVILIVIIIIHFLVVHLIFLKDRKAEPPVNPPSGGQTGTIPEPTIKVPGSSGSAGQNSSLKPKNKLKIGTPLDFRYAINGNISSLPGSKTATTGLLLDVGSHRVLWAKNPNKKVPIASLTKMMTLLVVFDIMAKRPDIALDSMVRVTESAYRVGGSQVYLDPRETFPLGELLKTVAVKSANDSAQLVAEFACDGDANQFVSKMNRKAGELGLKSTTFYNPHGLPPKNRNHPENTSTARDLALLGEQLLHYSKIMEWSATWAFTFRDKSSPDRQDITNHNRLVKNCTGVDGLKTGYTQKAGYCTVVSCVRGGNRLIAVVTGFPSWKSRDNFVRKLLAWGYKRRLKVNQEAAISK